MSQIIINGQPLYQVDLPEMTLAEWLALPEEERPKTWIRTDADYTDIPAENVSYGSGSVKDVLDKMNFQSSIKKITVGQSGSTFNMFIYTEASTTQPSYLISASANYFDYYSWNSGTSSWDLIWRK